MRLYGTFPSLGPGDGSGIYGYMHIVAFKAYLQVFCQLAYLRG